MHNLILVRHGKTEFNIQKRFTGFTDVNIVEEGRRDAHTVAQKIKASGVIPTKIYTSWLKRAWQTLEIIQEDLQLDVPVTKHPFLNERHYGDLQGLFHSEMAEKFGEEQVQIWRRSYSVRPPNGESLSDVVQRVHFYYESEILPQLRAGEIVLVCGHSNANRAFVKMMENISDADIPKREIAYNEPLFYTVEF